MRRWPTLRAKCGEGSAQRDPASYPWAQTRDEIGPQISSHSPGSCPSIAAVNPACDHSGAERCFALTSVTGHQQLRMLVLCMRLLDPVHVAWHMQHEPEIEASCIAGGTVSGHRPWITLFCCPLTRLSNMKIAVSLTFNGRILNTLRMSVGCLRLSSAGYDPSCFIRFRDTCDSSGSCSEHCM